MLKVSRTFLFKKDFKRINKRHYKLSLFTELLDLLRNQEELPKKFKNYPLHGVYEGFFIAIFCPIGC